MEKSQKPLKQPKKKHQKVTEFYFRKDIVCTAPVMKDVITIHENEEKMIAQTLCDKVFVREPHSFSLKPILILV